MNNKISNLNAKRKRERKQAARLEQARSVEEPGKQFRGTAVLVCTKIKLVDVSSEENCTPAGYITSRESSAAFERTLTSPPRRDPVTPPPKTARRSRLDDKPKALPTQHCKSCDSTKPKYLFRNILTDRPALICAECQQSEASFNITGVRGVRASSQKVNETKEVEQELAERREATKTKTGEQGQER